jgi:hypothetical protein
MKNRNVQKSAKGILVAAIVWSLYDVGAAFAQVGMGAITPPLGITSPLGIGAAAPALALAVETPAFAVGLRGVSRGGAMHIGSGGFRGARASVGSVVSSGADAACRQRWAYYDPTSRKYMGDDGEWHPCP